MMNVGEPAPDFEVLAHTGERVRLSSLRGKTVVLYFYPKAMTSGCTREGQRFNELLEEFERRGAVVLGISTDSVESNRKFAELQGFRFKLLCDVERSVSKSYGVLSESGTAERVTFVIDGNGIIRKILRNIRPAERHADEALAAVKEIAGA